MKKISTRKIITLYMILFLLVVLTSVILAMYFSYKLKLRKETPNVNYSQYYAMVTSDRNTEFWQSVYEGAFESGREKGVMVELLGDGLSEEYSDEELMKIAIASDFDGIIVYADESDEMKRLIDEAVSNNIPVVTVYGDNAASGRCSYVGVASFSIGREYGKQIVKAVYEKEQSDTLSSTHQDDVVNVVVLMDTYADDSSRNVLWSGIQNVTESDTSVQSKINLIMESVDNRNAFTVEESIRDVFKSSENPDIIVCLNEINTASVYQAVVDYNKVGSTTIIGYYDSPTILKGISRGVIFSTVSLDTEQMGRYSVEALYEYNESGNTSQYRTADITLIDRKNVDEIITKNEEGEE